MMPHILLSNGKLSILKSTKSNGIETDDYENKTYSSRLPVYFVITRQTDIFVLNYTHIKWVQKTLPFAMLNIEHYIEMRSR